MASACVLVLAAVSVSACTWSGAESLQAQDLEVTATAEPVPPASVPDTMRAFGYDGEHGEDIEASLVRLQWRVIDGRTVAGRLHYFVQWPEDEWQYTSWRSDQDVELSRGSDQVTEQLADEHGFLSHFRTVSDAAGSFSFGGPPVFTFLSRDADLPPEASVELLFLARSPTQVATPFPVDVAVGYSRAGKPQWAKEVDRTAP